MKDLFFFCIQTDFCFRNYRIWIYDLIPGSAYATYNISVDFSFDLIPTPKTCRQLWGRVLRTGVIVAISIHDSVIIVGHNSNGQRAKGGRCLVHRLAKWRVTARTKLPTSSAENVTYNWNKTDVIWSWTCNRRNWKRLTMTSFVWCWIIQIQT